MQIDFLNVISIGAVSLWLFSLGYLFFALIAVEHFNYKKNKKTIMENFHPSVTILKPIYGLDPDMLDNLRSFCQQDYPQYQVIFGIQDKNDPALSIVEEITKEFSKSDVSYIINTERHGTNHKVSNLINMYPYIKHEYILIADSDTRVSKNFLTQVISPFSDTKIGAVTCLYNGIANDKIASKLNAMFINNWFLPSVLISRILQPMKYCLGATMIVKRNILKKIGGFESLSNHIADDYMLGKLISNFGYRIYLSDYIVENIIEETSFKNLILHELRWARTLKQIEPLGYALTFLTDSLVLSIFTGITLFITIESLILLYLPIVITLSLRVLLHNSTNKMINSKRVTEIWLIPLRDILSFCIRIISYIGNSVRWRNNTFVVDHLGLMHEKKILSSDDPNAIEKIPDLLIP
jgi:ceramide glucosyltransferase